MITLPSPRRAQLRAFCLVQGAIAAIVTMVVAGLLDIYRYMWLAIVPFVLMTIIGFWYQRLAARLYIAWSSLAELYATRARRLVLKICYFVVFAAVGRAGSAMQTTAVRESLWVSRATKPPENYGSQCDMAMRDSSRSWALTYLNWAGRSRNVWAAGLLPFLMLIAALDTQKSTSSPVAIYTLF